MHFKECIYEFTQSFENLRIKYDSSITRKMHIIMDHLKYYITPQSKSIGMGLGSNCCGSASNSKQEIY